MATSCSIRIQVAAFKLRNCLSGQRRYARLSQALVGASWRGFSSDSKSKDSEKLDKLDKLKENAKGDSASRKADAEKDAKKVSADKKEAISKQLLQQILSMKVTGTDSGEEKESLILARPTWGDRREQIKEAKRIEKEKASEHPELDLKMVSAVKDVASNLGGNIERTETELIQKLKSHKAETDEIKSGFNLGNLVAGLKIDRTRAPAAAGVQDRMVQGGLPDEILDERERRPSSMSRRHGGPSKRPVRSESMDLAIRSDIDLFGAPLLNIFTKTSVTSDAPELEFPVLETWDKLEEQEMKHLVTQPFANAFEEQIQWTKEGKLWKFPINNEQGLDEEAKVGFHQHVFLDHLIEDFPKRGPIRVFMELVIVGLSKNSYLSIQQKKEHVEWFRNYFNDKEAILKEVGALG